MTERQINPGVYLNVQPTQQFSTSRIEFNFSTKMTTQATAARTLAAKMIENSSQQYQSQTQLARVLSDMYGADFGVDVLKVGQLHVVKAHLALIDDRFVDEIEPLFPRGLQFLIEMLFNPLGNDQSGFDATIFNRQQELLLDEVAGLADDRPYLANRHAMQAYFDDTAQGWPAYGTAEAIQAVTPLAAWQALGNMTQNDRLDIVISGNVDEQMVLQLLDQYTFTRTNQLVQPYYHQAQHALVQTQTETQLVNQSQLVLIYQLVVAQEDRFSAYVFEQVFGGTPVSRLFLDVRETKGLAYTISTDYNRFTDVLMVSAGIAGNQVDATFTAIQKNLKQLQTTLISESEMETVKKLMRTEFMVSLDSQSQITDRAFVESITGQGIDHWFEMLDAVTPESVQAMAQRMQLQIQYVLKGELTDGDE